ncbi:uncharacterized protein PO1_contig-111-27 [Mycobacterium sp. PO1]|nr:uncharacterized protein PO1_contig-111-27 [Mycobacterium sp. PO1]GFM25687.1 uncharacterized protein PO2_contig-072-27 [Mycobacterium sp. PO2]
MLLIKNRWNVFKYDDEDAIPAKHKGRRCDTTAAAAAAGRFPRRPADARLCRRGLRSILW